MSPTSRWKTRSRKPAWKSRCSGKFYKLVEVEKKVKVAGCDRPGCSIRRSRSTSGSELPDGATLKSGDLVEIELEIDSKNDYEYILFEDMKASGFEPVEVRSGYNGNDLHAYMELRDERVASSSAPWPAASTVSLSHAGGDPRQIQRPAHQGQCPLRPGAEGQLR